MIALSGLQQIPEDGAYRGSAAAAAAGRSRGDGGELTPGKLQAHNRSYSNSNAGAKSGSMSRLGGRSDAYSESGATAASNKSGETQLQRPLSVH